MSRRTLLDILTAAAIIAILALVVRLLPLALRVLSTE